MLHQRPFLQHTGKGILDEENFRLEVIDDVEGFCTSESASSRFLGFFAQVRAIEYSVHGGDA